FRVGTSAKHGRRPSHVIVTRHPTAYLFVPQHTLSPSLPPHSSTHSCWQSTVLPAQGTEISFCSLFKIFHYRATSLFHYRATSLFRYELIYVFRLTYVYGLLTGNYGQNRQN